MPILNFKGKSFVHNHHLAVKYHQLVPKKDKSLTDKVSLYDNLIVQGDNLKALKALLPTYAGKIKCIYIDPPYNTGNEGWAYNDKVNSPMMREWLGNVVDKDDLTRHDKWLCMMMPRLKLLRELLAEDGAIFISIDDNEQHNLRCLMDEIFGSNNFITNIIWQKKYSPQNDAKYFSDMHDFVLCYAKNKIEGEVKFGWQRNLLERTEEMNKRYSNPDNDHRGVWKSSDFSVKTYSKEYDYPIELPSGRIVNPPQGRSWSTSEQNFKELIKDNRIWFGTKDDSVPSVKKFLTEVKQGIVPVTIWNYSEVGHNQQAKQDLKEFFSEIALPFDTPKPYTLIKRIIQLSSHSNDIILDSFAGSGTTAHAVLNLNKEDNGNRKFILVEMEDYANDITAERVRRVIKGVPTSKNFKEGTGGTFSYFELGEPIEMESILRGENLPSFEEFAKYLFYTATGEEFDNSVVSNKLKSGKLISNDENFKFIGESRDYEVFLIYKPDIDYLKSTALTLDRAKSLGKHNGKKRLVFAPAKFVDNHTLTDLRIEFSQLPFEIYKLKS
ncbi:MAG: site-specific DNA-methyltransferase [Draconibacterium sp.]|nr:site-specific DNA-methyltransferase [Draconibacterium sp.]